MDSGIVLVLALTVLFGMVLPVVLFIPAAKRPVSEENLLCQDRYLEVYHDRLVISGYYFGPFGRKNVLFPEVEKVEAVDLSWKTGKYRLQGTEDFRTWFAQDLNRPSKKKAFVITRRKKRLRIGFSAENFSGVFSILQEKGLVRRDSGHGAEP